MKRSFFARLVSVLLCVFSLFGLIAPVAPETYALSDAEMSAIEETLREEFINSNATSTNVSDISDEEYIEPMQNNVSDDEGDKRSEVAKQVLTRPTLPLERPKCERPKLGNVMVCGVSDYFTLGLTAEGTVIGTAGSESEVITNEGQLNTGLWTDIVQIAVGTGNDVTYSNKRSVGLTAEGSVVSTSSKDNLAEWKDIVQIACSGEATLGLKSDGTVIVSGTNTCGSCDVSNWTDIVQISSDKGQTVGLKSNGTVIVAGTSPNGSISGLLDTSKWYDIVQVVAASSYILGLKSDGTVLCWAHTSDGRSNYNNVNQYGKVVMLSQSLALMSDGSVQFLFQEDEYDSIKKAVDIVRVFHNVALKSDGTLVSFGVQRVIEIGGGVADIAQPYGSAVLKKDGTLLTNGTLPLLTDNLYSKVETGGGLIALRTDGVVDVIATYTSFPKKYKQMTLPSRYIAIASGSGGFTYAVDESGMITWSHSNSTTISVTPYVSGWSDIVDIAAGDRIAIGLKSDGSVVSFCAARRNSIITDGITNVKAIDANSKTVAMLLNDGTVCYSLRNKYNIGDVSSWRNITQISMSDRHTVGLKSDGTVIATGSNSYGQCNVTEWKDITKVIALDTATVGIKLDGSLVWTKTDKPADAQVNYNWYLFEPERCYLTSESFLVHVLGEDGPIEGASVVVNNSKEYTTSVLGNAIILKEDLMDENCTGIQINAAGYEEYFDETFPVEWGGYKTIPLVQGNCIMDKAEMTLNGKTSNLLFEKRIINLAFPNTTFDISCLKNNKNLSTNNKYRIVEFKDEETGTAYDVVAENKNGLFTGLEYSDFELGARYYIEVFNSNSKQIYKARLNLSVVDVDESDFATTIGMGEDVRFTIPSFVPGIGGNVVSVDFPVMPVDVEVSDEKAIVGTAGTTSAVSLLYAGSTVYTFTVHSAYLPLVAVARIFALPADTAVTKPVKGSTVATASLTLVYVTVSVLFVGVSVTLTCAVSPRRRDVLLSVAVAFVAGMALTNCASIVWFSAMSSKV